MASLENLKKIVEHAWKLLSELFEMKSYQWCGCVKVCDSTARGDEDIRNLNHLTPERQLYEVQISGLYQLDDPHRLGVHF